MTEYAKENKQSKLTIENFKADMIEEQAKATEELIAVLTENTHTTDGDPHQKHHQSNERDDVPHQE